MKYLNYFLGFTFVSSILIVLLFTQSQDGEQRTEFEFFLNNHPIHQKEQLTPKEWKKKLPKKDRPDLAMEHEFFMTIDPATRTVPRERLIAAYNYAESFSQNVSREVDWTEHGPDNVAGRTRAILFDPNDSENKKVWAGGVAGGLWMTEDITQSNPSWNNVDNFWDNCAITTLASDPGNTQIFYAGTGEGWYNGDAIRGAGIWKSEDGGSTWSNLSNTQSNSEFYYIQKIVVHPSNGKVFAATRGYYSNEGGVFMSSDGGNSWNRVLGPTQTGNSYSSCADIEIASDGSLYAAMGIFYTGGLYKSTDGTNWQQINSGSNGFQTGGFYRLEIAVSPSDPNTVYVVGQSTGGGSYDIALFVKSTDGGATWNDVSIPNNQEHENGNGNAGHFTRGQAFYDLILQVSPSDANIVYTGGIDLHKTTNGGTSWSPISHWWGGYGLPNVHADQHAIVFRPGNSNYIVFGNDGGIYVSEDAGTSYSHRNSGYNVTQFYSCAVHPEAGNNYFLAGAQDNGSQQFMDADGIVSTNEVTGGDGAFCFIDQTNPNYQITSYVNNNYYVSTNGGSSFGISNLNSDGGRFINPCDYDNDANILYTARDASSIYRWNMEDSDNDGYFDESTFDIDLGNLAAHIRVSEFSENTIFIGTGAGRLFKVTNANVSNPSVTEITNSNFPTGYISCIELGETEDQLLITFSNYGVSSIWETQNGGSSWLEKEGNLPDMPIRWAVYNPTNPNEVVLATEVGVWSTLDINATSPSWVPSSAGLGNIRTDMFQIRSSDNLLVAATHGRGVFSSSGFQFLAEASISTSTINVTGTPGTTSTDEFQITNVGENGSNLSFSITSEYPESGNRDQQFILYYDENVFSGGTLGAINLPYESGTGVNLTQYGTRFSPTGNVDILEGAWFFFGQFLDSENSTIPELNIYVYGNGGSNFPGEELGSVGVDMDTYLYNGWNYVDLSSLNLSFESGADFFITVKVENGVYDEANWNLVGIQMLTDLGGMTNDRSVVYFENTNSWNSYQNTYGSDREMLIKAQVYYADDPNNSWLSVNPVSGSIGANETQNIQVNFDATELDYGTYTAKLFVNYNAGSSDTIDVSFSLPNLGQDEIVPNSIALHQNYPNPFNPSTSINFTIENLTNPKTSLQVFDLGGRLVKTLVNESLSPGYHTIIWDATNHDGKNVSAGIYYYTLEIGEFKESRKMTLLK